MGELRVMTQEGDIRLTWDPDREASVAQTRQEFDRLRRDGYDIYRVTAKGRKSSKRVDTFDPVARELLAVPGVQSQVERTVGRKIGGQVRPRAMAGGPNDAVGVLR